MRELADIHRIRQFMEAVARAADAEVAVHLVGGTTAVLIGWRSSTVDVDFVMQPENEAVFRAIPALKERLRLNVELASPAHFIPVPAGWEERGTFVVRDGLVTFYHFDLYAQALAKIERGHRQDVSDVQAMLTRGLVERSRLLEYFQRVEADLHRFPAIHGPAFRRAVELATADPA